MGDMDMKVESDPKAAITSTEKPDMASPVSALRDCGVENPEELISKLEAAGFKIEKSGEADKAEDATEGGDSEDEGPPSFAPGTPLSEQIGKASEYFSKKTGGGK